MSLMSQFRRFGGLPSTPAAIIPPQSPFLTGPDTASAHSSTTGTPDPSSTDTTDRSAEARLSSRRPRSDSQDVERVRESKRLRLRAIELERDYGLDEGDLAEFAQLSLPDMLISVYAETRALAKRRTTDERTEFMESSKFARTITKRVQWALLSPNLPAYVTGMGDKFTQFVLARPDVFKIPANISLEDLDFREKVKRLVSAALTEQRSAMRQKIAAAISQKQDVNTLWEKVSYKSDMEVSMAHWVRLAFLRRTAIAFKQMRDRQAAQAVAQDSNTEPVSPVPPIDPQLLTSENSPTDPAPVLDANGDDNDVVYGNNSFWVYVDNVLESARNDTESKTSSPEEYCLHMKTFYMEIFQADLRQYPLPKKGRSAFAAFAVKDVIVGRVQMTVEEFMSK